MLVGTENGENSFGESQGPSGGTSVVQTLSSWVEGCVTVVNPELESVGRHIGTELGEQDISKVVDTTIAENLPNLLLVKRLEGGQFQLQKVVLTRVQVNSVNLSWWIGKGSIIQDIVTSGSDGQNSIVTRKLQDVVIFTRILPGETVNVLVSELVVLGVDLVKVHSPRLTLVVGRREWQVFGQVGQGSFVALADRNVVFLGLCLLRGGKIRRLSCKTIDSVKQSRRSGLVAANPHIVWNTAQHVVVGVQRLEGSELVLQVVTSGGIQENLVCFEPDTPEVSQQPGDVSVHETTHGVDSAHVSVSTLNTKINAGNDTVGTVQELNRMVDHRVEGWDHQQRVREGDQIRLFVGDGEIGGIR